jgi:hypothetical protein
MFLLTVKRSPSCNFLHIPIFVGVLEIHVYRGGLSTWPSSTPQQSGH